MSEKYPLNVPMFFNVCLPLFSPSSSVSLSHIVIIIFFVVRFSFKKSNTDVRINCRCYYRSSCYRKV